MSSSFVQDFFFAVLQRILLPLSNSIQTRNAKLYYYHLNVMLPHGEISSHSDLHIGRGTELTPFVRPMRKQICNYG